MRDARRLAERRSVFKAGAGTLQVFCLGRRPCFQRCARSPNQQQVGSSLFGEFSYQEGAQVGRHVVL